MNAPEAHYVANADAKVQLFSGIAIALWHFFVKQPRWTKKSKDYFQTKAHKGLTMAYFLAIFV